ncbi:histone-lysine N-methyltransferase SETD1B-like [Chenopodium quinoa]|uniref:histone-lysine N-methyltransferase SETD1B-like n=1 Tax=Chenopodium quinoa TaxID=63459 RepID=UPI000B797420|nr:histone-lysine N-methyltransferase SETD1B-like [Chenopodium quinoa]
METAESSNRGRKEREEVKVKLKTLKAVMEQCQRALESLNADGLHDDADNSDDNDDDDEDDSKVADERDNCGRSSPSSSPDYEAEELCGLIKSRLEGPEFLERIESAQLSVQQKLPGEEGNSWDMVSDNDLWEGGSAEDDEEDFVVVRQEDIVDGIACFMAAYLLSLKQTKDLSPNKLQDALSKTFSIKKRKGKLRKALDGTRVIYNVASWSATAVGIYQNPALLRVATTAFWTSCRVISRLF